MSGVCTNCRSYTVEDFSSCFTDAAEKILNKFQSVDSDATLSVTGPRRRLENIMSEVIEVQEDCREDNWDGENAVGITSAALFEALAFVKALPDEMDLPDVTPTASGAIDFEWRKGGARCNVELSGNGEIVYSAYFSHGNRDFGVKPFVRKIHSNVIALLERMA